MAASATPCTTLVGFLDGWVPMAGQAFGFGAGSAVGSVIQSLAAQLSQFLGASEATAAAQAAAFGQLLSTLGLLGQLSALSELYTHTTAKVTSDNGDGPFAQPAVTAPTTVLPFTVTAGVSDADWGPVPGRLRPRRPGGQRLRQPARPPHPERRREHRLGHRQLEGLVADVQQDDHLGQISLQDNPDFSFPGDLAKTLAPNSRPFRDGDAQRRPAPRRVRQ